MTAKNTVVASFTQDGKSYSKTRTSDRTYTHAALRGPFSDGEYCITFHQSIEQAQRKSSSHGPSVQVVDLTAPVAEVEAPKAPAKRAPRKAATTKVDPALAEIVQFVLGGAHTAKTENSKTVLNKAAGQLKAGKVEDARKTLYPIRTRVALAAIKMIKAL